MRLLRDLDYKKVTLSDEFRELIADNHTEWLNAEQVAQEEVYSKLVQRYIIGQILTNTTVYDSTLVYKGKNLIEYTEADWLENTSYTATQRIRYGGKIYQCILASQGYLPINTTYWTYITDDLSLYYVTLPYNEWDKTASYIIGSKVWFLDKTYTAIVANININPTTNAAIWGSGVAYSITNKNPDILWKVTIPYTVGVKVVYNDLLYTCILNSTGNLPTNITYFTVSTTLPYWTKGDNRNPLIVRYLLDMARYHFERAIPSRNISEQTLISYDGNHGDQRGGAIGWLKRVAAGTDTANLPEIIITQGLSFTYGNTRSSLDNQTW